MIFSHPYKKIPSSAAIFLINLALLLLYLLLLSHAGFFAAARLKTIDTLFQIRAQFFSLPKNTDRIVIIGVDDASYRRLNRAWPWGRELFAVFLDHLKKLEPAAVGIDFSFVGKSSDPSVDEWLRDAIRTSGHVVLASYFDKDGSYVLPLESLRQAASGYGFTDKTLDKDAVGRRSRQAVLLGKGQGHAFSFAAQLALMSQNAKAPDPERFKWLSYRYKSAAFRYFSFWEVVAGQVPPDAVRGRIALVGPISLIFHDYHATPLGVMQGVHSLANEILMILDHDFISEIKPLTQIPLWVVLIAIATLIFSRFGYLTRFMLFLIAEAAAYGASCYLFVAFGLLLEPFPMMFVLATTYVVALFYRGLSTFLENAALQKLVITDSLTGLYDHRYLSMKLKTEFEWRKSTKSEFFFVMVDIDFFKKVNDEYGHEEGNRVLMTVAKILKSGVRVSDVVARYGGEEFSLILFDVDDKGAFQTVERIRSAVEASHFTAAGGKLKVTISAGICSNKNPDIRSKDDLARLADHALYQAKSSGRNRTCIYLQGSSPLTASS